MVLQVPQVGEALTTLVTHELFLPGVDLLVGLQAVALVEAAPARVAAERLLPGVDTLVSVQVARVAETFPTRGATEGFLSSVDHLRGEGRQKTLHRQCCGSPSIMTIRIHTNPPDEI